MSAYACAPARGSEPEVGLRALIAAARHHEIWLLTREKNVVPVSLHLTQHAPELLERVHLVGLDLGVLPRHIKGYGEPGLYAYYDAWQRRARDVARRLDARVNFDVVHHITFASYWTRAGVTELGKPTVWGPVGGGAGPPWRLFPVLGWRGGARSVVRAGAQRLLAGVLAPRPSNHLLALVHNPQTAAAAGQGRVVTHAIAVDVDPPDGTPSKRSSEVLVVGRLVAFKAVTLAVRTMRHVRHPGARLVICGDGPDRPRVEAAIRRYGVEHCVEIVGRIPRDDVLRRVATAGVLLHPALHEDAGIAVAEALSLRTPVVALDHAGPAVSTKWWPQSPAALVAPQTPSRTARALAEHVDRFLAQPEPVARRAEAPVRTLEAVLTEAYAEVCQAAADAASQ